MPFPTGRKSSAGIAKVLPTRRKFRRNLLDNVPSLSLGWKGQGSARTGGAKAGKSSLHATMCMKRKHFERIREISIKSHLVACKEFNDQRGSGCEEKRGIKNEG